MSFAYGSKALRDRPSGMRCRKALILILPVVLACSTSENQFPLDPGNDTTGGPPGTVQRITVNVKVTADSAATPLVATLGLSPQGVSGVNVHLRRGGAAQSLNATTDASGVAQFTDVLPGSYQVSGIRQVQPAERSLLPPFPPIDVFGHAMTASLDSATTNVELTLSPGERGSLVISEFMMNAFGDPAIGSYYFGGYIELYNASDTTIYLDGLMIGRGFDLLHDYSVSSCESNLPFRSDPLGIWFREIHAFPGSGTTYPLQPGQVVLIATDAIDHSAAWAGLDDLSSADFESIGPADVNNPAVPDLISRGINNDVAGHGYRFNIIGAVPFVALPTEVSTLASAQSLTAGLYYRMPADRILDVAAVGVDPAIQLPYPHCPEFVHPSFDQEEGLFLKDNDMRATHRRLLGRVSDGRAILQRSRATVRDFTRATRTPGVSP